MSLTGVKKNTVAIIPARGASKGIILKNIRYLCGKPMIVHTIEAAIKAETVNRVFVSTDHPKIAEIATKHGAEVIIRPNHLSGDLASSESALLHALAHLDVTESLNPDLCVFLQCTSPLTISADIDNCVSLLLRQNADTAFTVAPFQYFIWKHDESGNAIGINHLKTERQLRQERVEQYIETGAIYVMRVKEFLRAKHRFFGKSVMHIVPPERCYEIDEPIDLNIADVLIKHQLTQQKSSLLPEKIEAVVFDFDGVFTNNTVVVHQNGKEAVVCNRADGMGISELRKHEIRMMVLSTEKNPVVAARCRKLGLECHQDLEDKVSFLRSWLKEHDISQENVVYLGNDINDAECLKAVGCSVVTSDAHDDVKPFARIMLKRSGGYGAVRELADLIIKKIQETQNAKKC